MSKDNKSNLHNLKDEAQERERVFEPAPTGDAPDIDAEESSLSDPEKSDVYFEDLAENELAEIEAEVEAELELSEKRKKDKMKARKKDEKAFKDAREKYERDIEETNKKRAREENERFNKENNNTVYDSANNKDYVSSQEENIPPYDTGYPSEKPNYDYTPDNSSLNNSNFSSYENEAVPDNGSRDVSDGSGFSSFGTDRPSTQTYDEGNRDLPSNNHTYNENSNTFTETEKKRKAALDAEFVEQQKIQQEKNAQNEAYIEKLNRAAIERQRNSENYKSFGHEGIDFSGKNQHTAYVQSSDDGSKTDFISEDAYNSLRQNYENSKQLFKSAGDNVSDSVITQYKEDSARFFDVQRKIDQGELTVSSTPAYNTEIRADNGSRGRESVDVYLKNGGAANKTPGSDDFKQFSQRVDRQSTESYRPEDNKSPNQDKTNYSDNSSKSGGSYFNRPGSNADQVKTNYPENSFKDNGSTYGGSNRNEEPTKNNYSNNISKDSSALGRQPGIGGQQTKTDYPESFSKGNTMRFSRSSLNAFEQNIARYACATYSQTNEGAVNKPESIKTKTSSEPSVYNIVRVRYESLQKKHSDINKEVASYSGKPIPQALVNKAEKINKLYSSIQSKIDNGSVKIVENAETVRRPSARNNSHSSRAVASSALGAQAFLDRSRDNFSAAGKRVGDRHIKPVGTPFQGSPISKYDKLKIYNAHNYAKPIESATRGTYRALGGAVIAAAQNEQTGTANMMLKSKDRARDAVNAVVAIKDLPRQLQTAYHAAQDATTVARNVGRFMQGKELLARKEHNATTLKQIDKQLNTKTNPFSSLEKDKLSKKFGAGVNNSIAKTDRKITIKTAQNKNLKVEIKALKEKGSALTSAERKKLKNLMDQKKKADSELRKLHGLKKAQADAAGRNGAAQRAKKSVEKTIKKNSKKGLRFSKKDKAVLSRLQDRKKLLDKQKKMQKAAASRKQLLSSLGGVFGKAARESEESTVQGIMGASRVLQNRYVRSILKVSVRAALWPVMKAKKLAGLGLKKLDNKLGVSKAVKKIEEKAVRKTINSRVYKELNGGLYNRTKKKIGSHLSERTKSRLNTGKKAVNQAKDKSRAVKKKFDALKERLKNSKLGKFASSLSNGFKDIANAFGVVKKAIIKVGISCGAVLLVVVLLGAFITSIGGAGASLFLGNDVSDDGRIDLSSYISTLNAEQEQINRTVTGFKNDTEANGGYYNKVYVNYLGGTNSNNYKEILSMAAVYFEQDFSNEEAVNNYITNLYKASNYVTTEESDTYYCSGCVSRTYKCTDEFDEFASSKRRNNYYRYSRRGGCIKYEELGKTKYKCDGNHTEMVCFGHKDLYVDVVCLGFDKIFNADPGTTVGLDIGNYAQGDLIGTFKITYYCAEKYPHICNAGPPYKTATGTTVTAGRTIAVDPNVIPLGTTVIINGHSYVAEDTGGAIKENRIDIAVNTHQEALNLGTDVFNVYYADEKTGEDSEEQVQRDVQEYLQRAQDASSDIISTQFVLQVFGAAKEPRIDWKYNRVNYDDENSYEARLQEYDEKHKNEPWSNAELNAFEYVNMSMDELKKLCKKRGLSDSESSAYAIITERLIPYDKKHPDEYIASPEDSSEEFYFLGWTDENKDWAKNIYSNMTDETYAGLDKIGASTATGSLSLEGVTIKGSKIDVTYFCQHDSRWANVAIRNDYPQHTISEAGCGFTSMSIVVSSLTSNTIDPVLMSALYGKQYYSPGVGAYWSLVSAVSADYGLSCSEMTINVQNVINALNEGKLVVATVGNGGQGYTGNGYYKGAGHFLVICGVTNDGKFILADPNNATVSTSGTGVDMQYFLDSGIKTWWAIGK